ncbi:MAG TPA: hypothetical protein VK308_01580, partial [Pyrinomonadaceae bacterium]|nr:hypothetical protein [Pyrinomonadaceae bacterium]
MKLALILFIVLLTTVFAPETLCQTRKATGTKSKGKAVTVKPLKTAMPPVPVYADEPPPLPPQPKISETAISDLFVDVEVGNWGIAGLSVPRDLKREKDWQMQHQNGDVSWTTYSRSWKSPVAGDEFAALDAEVSVTIWNSPDFSFVPDLRADLKTPENLLLIDLMGEINNKNTPGSHVKEAKMINVGDVEGGYFLANIPSDKRRFIMGWYTYRIFDGKAQRISLNVTGRRSELPKAMKI